MVQVGEAGSAGTLTAVRSVIKPSRGPRPAPDQDGAPTGGTMRRYDCCGPGLGWCRHRERSPALPQALSESAGAATAKISSASFTPRSAASATARPPDRCKPVSPRPAAGKDMSGKPLGCYVLADDKAAAPSAWDASPLATAAARSMPLRALGQLRPRPGLHPASGRESVCRSLLRSRRLSLMAALLQTWRAACPEGTMEPPRHLGL